MHNKVVCTGIGVIAPNGNSRQEFWNNSKNGQSGIQKITLYDTSNYPCQIGGEIKGFNPSDYFVPDDEVSDLGRVALFALAATRMGFQDAGLDEKNLAPESVGVAIGNNGDMPLAWEIRQKWIHGDLKQEPDLIWRYPLNAISAAIANAYGLNGPNAVFATSCAAGNHAIAHAFDQLQSGVCDVMVTGGVESIPEDLFACFCQLRSLAEEKCQPFDKNRKGLILSEGAGILILETLEHALGRGARIYGEVLGYGMSSDAHHLTFPHPQGEGAVEAMRGALRHAGVRPEEIDYISAHGTGTPPNDKIETMAIKEVFGPKAMKLPTSSVKSMIGHSLGASAAIEACVSFLTIHEGVIIPTINYETPDPDCDLDYVPNVCRERDVRTVLSNSFGFGGNNIAVVFRDYSG
jgi:3-oxoacyl-[acyl-carrier-protein] synthase II